MRLSGCVEPRLARGALRAALCAHLAPGPTSLRGAPPSLETHALMMATAPSPALVRDPSWEGLWVRSPTAAETIVFQAEGEPTVRQLVERLQMILETRDCLRIVAPAAVLSNYGALLPAGGRFVAIRTQQDGLTLSPALQTHFCLPACPGHPILAHRAWLRGKVGSAATLARGLADGRLLRNYTDPAPGPEARPRPVSVGRDHPRPMGGGLRDHSLYAPLAVRLG